MKINISPKAVKGISLSEINSKFNDKEMYEVSGEDIKRASKGIFEQGKNIGFVFGATTVFVAWAANSAIDWLQKKFQEVE